MQLICKAVLLGILSLLVGGFGLAAVKPNSSKSTVRPIAITAKPIRSFGKVGGGRGRVGRLRFRGGLVLRSPDPGFGGLSGLEISSNGRQLLAVSDSGAWLKAKLAYDGERPRAVVAATIGPILALGNKRLRRGRDRDAEAVRLLRGNLDSGIVLLGFERNQRIGFFKLTDGRVSAPQRYLRPPMRLKSNKGIEAAGVLKGGPQKGAIVAFAERTLDHRGRHHGWFWRGKKVHPLTLENIDGFDITDVAGAPDGYLYVLERRFRWSEGVKMRIRRIAPRQFKPGAALKGEIMMSADLSSEIDNMEGLAIHLDKAKRTVLTVISDNNFNTFLQRTILLQFEVVS